MDFVSGNWEEQNFCGGCETSGVNLDSHEPVLHLGLLVTQQHPGPGPQVHVLPDGDGLLQHLLQTDHRPDVQHQVRAVVRHPRPHLPLHPPGLDHPWHQRQHGTFHHVHANRLEN